MGRFLLSCIAIIISSQVFGNILVFKTVDNKPIEEVKCVGYNAKGDSLAYWISNKDGLIDIKISKELNYLLTSHPGYSDKIIEVTQLLNSNNNITLIPVTDLNEVVVTPSDVEEFDRYTSYRISEKDMARYPNVLQALNEIPNLTVLTSGAMFFEGGTNIKILIDGIESTHEEVQSLAKEDIAKINVYSVPPTRFISQGILAVMDIRLKSKIHGGNIVVNLKQAFQSLIGNNSAAFLYNFKQSRFNFSYNNTNRHLRKFNQSEVLDYEFDNIDYIKTKQGIDSKRHLDDNNFNLSYQINIPENFVYKVKTGLDINREGGNLKQDVMTNNLSFM